MADQSTENTILLDGRVIGFIPPTEGQFQAMIRIARTLQRGTDDEAKEFWIKQIDRIGVLLEAMIVEGDRDLVDELYLTGKIDHAVLLKAIMDKVNEKAVVAEDKAIAKAKTTSVKRR